MSLLIAGIAIISQVTLLVLTPCLGQDSSIPYLVGVSPIITYVRENAEINHEVVDLHAYDPQGSLVNYSLQTDGPFGIDTRLGRIFVSGSLDREMIDEYMLVATVTDTEGLSANISVDVTVLDVNDNPPQVDNTLNITLRELTEVGTRVHTIITSDPDIGDAGSVEFILVSNGDFVTDHSFSIAQFSGDITLVQSLDHEAVGLHILTVRIADLGSPALSTVVNLTINVLDENDTAPVFTRSLYTARVPETNMIGVRVTRVMAMDAHNRGVVINYNIVFGNVDDAFEIQSDGHIITRNILDHEIRHRYILTVEATEASTTSDAAPGITTVTVEVEDVNDNPPTFHASLYTGFAREDATIGTNIITTIAAFDNDLGDNAEFRFRLSPQNTAGIPFAIYSNRGVIYVNEQLDFEIDSFYEFEIEAYEIRSAEMLSGTAMVHIFIININDNPPLFALDRYYVSVTEEQPPGVVVATIMATDGDAGPAGILTYTLSGAGNQRFSVDTNGTIRTTETLDREDTDQYHLTLITMDISNNPLITTTTVIIDVTDINDNCPKFDPSENYDFMLPEEMAHPNFFIPTVEDRDLGINAQYTFSISDNINFNVSQTSGALSLINAALDHEVLMNRSFLVLMTACDMGTNPAQMCCNQTINVTLRDKNDNTPLFALDRYYVTVTEEQVAGIVVTTITATDEDAGPAGILTYTLSGAGNQRFSVDTNGAIRTTETLDREETDQYHLTLIAMDISNNPLIITTTVIIDVTDINDNCPEFDPSENYNFMLPEKMAHPDFFIPTVVDRDFGVNAQYTFSISDNRNFDVSQTSGALSLINAALDYEAVMNRPVRVVMTACDMGTNPAQMCCSQTINIMLRDGSDNTPQLEHPPIAVGSSCSSIVVPITIAIVLVTLILGTVV